MIFLRLTWHCASSLILLLSLAACALAQSPDLPSGDSNPRTNNAGNAAATPAQTTTAIQIVNSPNNSEPSAQQQQSKLQQFKENALTDPIVLLTLALFVLGSMQWWTTRRQANIAATQNQIVTTQNTIMETQNTIMEAQNVLMMASADTLHTVERAVVKMSHQKPGVVWNGPHSFATLIDISNFGNTHARVTNVVLNGTVRDISSPLPREPDYSVPPNYVNRGAGTEAFLVKGDKMFIPYAQEMPDMRNAVDTAKTHKLFLIGYVDYIDAFGCRYRAGYGRVYFPESDDREGWPDDESFSARSNLVFVTQPRYNYDRKREKGEGEDWNEEIYGKAPP